MRAYTIWFAVLSVLSLCCGNMRAQDGQQDTAHVNSLIEQSLSYSNNNFKQALHTADQALDLAEDLHFIKGVDGAYNAIADAYWYHSDYEMAQVYYFKSYKLNDSIHNNLGIAYAMYNIGWILCIQQHNFKEDHYLYKSMGLFNELRDTIGLLRVFNALGSSYTEQFKTRKEKPLFDSSLKYYSQALKLSSLPKYRSRRGNFVSNMADLYANADDYNTAIFYNDLGTQINQERHDTATVMMNYSNKAIFLCRLKRYDEAIALHEMVVSYCIKHDIKDLRSFSLRGLAECYEQLGEYPRAYVYFKEYSELADSLNKQMYSTSLQQMESLYELSKAETNLKELKQVSEIQELKNKQNMYFIFVLIGVAVVVLLIAVLLFRQNKQKQQANLLLQSQKNEITEKKREIENSIQYAKGIQNAILPALGELQQVFPSSFVFYQPKDVVSGDFYWFHKAGRYFYCIAADCTGHGVPGALMSIIGVDKIGQALFEKKIEKPDAILSFLNQEIKHVLKQHNDEAKQKDGMDIALLRFNLDTRTVEYAAANRPLLIVRKGQLTEYKPDKVAIAGFTPPDQVYHLNTIQLEQGDAVFIFSDGYADQFGGESGKKFMTKNLKELLVAIANEKAEMQEEKVRSTFHQWKGLYEQVDDVLVIGINIS